MHQSYGGLQPSGCTQLRLVWVARLSFRSCSAVFGITIKISAKDSQSVTVYCLCLSWCGEQVHLSVQSQPWISFLLWAHDHSSSGIFRCKDAIKKELARLPLFKVFPPFPPPSSLSLLLSVPIKGQWISLPYFQVTSSVFDFYAYLKLAMGLTF